MENTEIALQRLGKVNVAYLTSMRELGLDEAVGQTVTEGHIIHPYRKGNLEDISDRLIHGDNQFAHMFNLAAIVSDDSDQQIADATANGRLWPNHTIPNNGSWVTLDDITYNISSRPWRQMKTKVDGIVIPSLQQQKQHAKNAYELKLVQMLEEAGVDLIVTDSYLTLHGPVMLASYGPRDESQTGLILNIHPAITEVGHPHRLPGLTPSRDIYTKIKYGKIIVDDKHAVDTPEGEPHEWYYPEENRTRMAVDVPKSNIHGVTVHIATQRVDNGPVVMYDEYAIPEDVPSIHGVRAINYPKKLDLLANAMIAYVSRPEVQDLILQKRVENRACQNLAPYRQVIG